MDLKDFMGGDKKTPKAASMQKDISQLDMTKLSGMVKGFESKSRDELMEDLRKAKRDGSINDESVAAFFSAMSKVLPKEQQEQMKKILDSLE